MSDKVFTDGDLRNLKDQLAGNAPTHGSNGGVDLNAFLSRLDAAEATADHFKPYVPLKKLEDCLTYKAWRKSRGLA